MEYLINEKKDSNDFKSQVCQIESKYKFYLSLYLFKFGGELFLDSIKHVVLVVVELGHQKEENAAFQCRCALGSVHCCCGTENVEIILLNSISIEYIEIIL
jgi:hypothetical protein